MRIDSWDSRAAQKRRQCAAKIPGHWKVPVSILHDLHEPLQEVIRAALPLRVAVRVFGHHALTLFDDRTQVAHSAAHLARHLGEYVAQEPFTAH